jgi:hypothetical protein
MTKRIPFLFYGFAPAFVPVLSPSLVVASRSAASVMITMAHAVSVVAAGASIAAYVSQPTLRTNLTDLLARWTGYNTPGGLWRIAAILLALANIKSLPFVWHVSFQGSFTPDVPDARLM